MSLNGYPEVTHGYNTLNKAGETGIVSYMKAVQVPIGAIIAWNKTFTQLTSGTTDGTTANKLINSGDTFQTDGVAKSFIVLNTTDTTETWVTNVDSETQLTVNDDIFVSGEDYEIYSTPYLPDGYVECNGQVLSDSDSPFDGDTIPDLNAVAGSDQRFLRGASESTGTGGSDNHSHTIGGPSGTSNVDATGAFSVASSNHEHGGNTGQTSTLPKYYEVVWIMRVK